MRHLVALVILLAGAVSAGAQTAAVQPGQVLVSGTMPDEPSKQAVLTRLREIYGPEMVVDQITIGQVATPANWTSYVQKLITPDLKSISRGQLKVDGNTVSIKGEVPTEATRQKIAGGVAASLNPTYTVNNSLRVSAADQGVLDSALANRIIEFDSGKATLTPKGRAILDEMVAAMLKLKDRKVDIIGHTDNQGLRASNQGLSQARAEAVKAYLSSHGINSELLSASGQGADRPIASNDSADGRARNRRIEFRMAQ